MCLQYGCVQHVDAIVNVVQIIFAVVVQWLLKVSGYIVQNTACCNEGTLSGSIRTWERSTYMKSNTKALATNDLVDF